MKKLKKLASVLLSVIMAFGVFAVIPVGAAETAAEETSADEQVIYFDVKKSGWEDLKNVYCHLWAADGSSTTNTGASWTQWQTKAEKCTYDSDTGIAAYDLSKIDNKFSADDGKIYCLIFSANTGMQTYTVIMSGSCIGDTLYCCSDEIENPADSQKTCYLAKWENSPDCGAMKAITSTGKVVGTANVEGKDDADLLAEYLITYYDDAAKTECTQDLIDILDLSVDDVQKAVDERLAQNCYSNSSTVSAAVKEILSECVDSYALGDVNGDGNVDISDATMIQKAVAKIITLTDAQQKAADVNGDDNVDITDATMVQKYVAKIIETFGTAQTTTQNSTTWQDLYIDYINSLDQDMVGGYALVYIDDDDIPELYIAARSHLSDSGKLCWINENQVCVMHMGSLTYIERGNLFMNSVTFTGATSDVVYTLNGSQADEIARGSYNSLPDFEYYRWNNVDMRKSEYFAARDSVINTSEAIVQKNNDLDTYSEICSRIRRLSDWKQLYIDFIDSDFGQSYKYAAFTDLICNDICQEVN